MDRLKPLLAYYFTFRGRISRSEYWLKFMLPMFVISLAIMVIIIAMFGASFVAYFSNLTPGTNDPEAFQDMLNNSGMSQVMALIQLIEIPIFIVTIFCYIRRLHDRNKQEAWVLLMFIPLFGQLWLFIELGFLKGTVGPNQYGPDPLAKPVEPMLADIS